MIRPANASGSSALPAGYIQFVVGITDWNPSSRMKSMNFAASSGCGALSASQHFDLHVMPFIERCRTIFVGAVDNDVIGGRGGVGQHHVGLAIKEHE